jgi:hypothetical protein
MLSASCGVSLLHDIAQSCDCVIFSTKTAASHHQQVPVFLWHDIMAPQVKLTLWEKSNFCFTWRGAIKSQFDVIGPQCPNVLTGDMIRRC